MTDEKIKTAISNYINYAKRHILEHKKDFSSISTIYQKFIKKDKVDPAFDYMKEIIKRMEKDKMSSQTAMQIAETLLPEVQNVKKDVLIMAIPMVLGAVLLTTFTFLFSFSKPFTYTNSYLISYAIGMFISSLLFGFGLYKRKDVKFKTLTRTMLFQASSAYGAAKMQGQGSFGAFRILDEMKTKQGKELQIRVNQPKIVYK